MPTQHFCPGQVWRRRRLERPGLYPFLDVGDERAAGRTLLTELVMVVGTAPRGSGWHEYAYVVTVGLSLQVGWTYMGYYERVL